MFKRFRDDLRATTAVEFGLLAVPFLALVLAIFETGFVFLTNEGLQVATQDAARNLMTGAGQQAGVATADQFRTTYLCPATGQRVLPSFIDCSKLIIDVRPASTFSAADTSSSFYLTPTTMQFCPGGPSTIVVVRVVYPMPVILPMFGFMTVGQTTTGVVNNIPNNSGWKHLLMGTAAFMTEPYPAANYTPPASC